MSHVDPIIGQYNEQGTRMPVRPGDGGWRSRPSEGELTEWTPGTRYPDLFAALAAPFESHEEKMRWGNKDKTYKFKYVDARVVMDRLDRVLGPENWEDTYTGWGPDLICTIKIILPDGTTLAKSGAAGRAGMDDGGDDAASAESHAFKRTAVKFGPGRYLYRLGPIYENGNGGGYQQPANGYGNGHAQPANGYGQPAAPVPQQGQPPAGGWGVPTRGSALYSWAKKQEETGGLGVVDHLNAWAKANVQLQAWAKASGNPQAWKMAEWPEEFVAQAYAEACTKLGIGQNQPVQSPVTSPTQPDNGEVHGLRQALWAMCRQLAKHSIGLHNDPSYSPPEESITVQVNHLLLPAGLPAVSSINQIMLVNTLRQLVAKAQEQLNIVTSFPAPSSTPTPF